MGPGVLGGEVGGRGGLLEYLRVVWGATMGFNSWIFRIGWDAIRDTMGSRSTEGCFYRVSMVGL